jgi:acetolactate synthase I/II/III large subunit
MDKSPQVKLQSTAHYFLEGLNEIGVDYLFSNMGTDHAPIIEEMARWRKAGLKYPPTILCPHENVAAHMALGYAQVTGRGQAVLVHVDVGTANAAMALHNFARARVPVLLMAGRAPYTVRGELPGSRDTQVHFIQEPYDQAGLVRPYVKWEYNLHSGVTTKEVLRRAHSMMHSDPMGPVYLTLPREVLAQPWEERAIASFPESRYGPVKARGTDPQTAGQIADKLLAAEYPILILRYAGRNPAFPALADELARYAAIRVFEAGPTVLNIPHDSPCFFGMTAGSAIPKADVGLMVDVDVPWIPADARERPDSFWIQVDVDAIKEKTPMWGFPTDLRIQGDSTIVLGQVLEALREKATPEFLAAARARMETIARESAARDANVAALAEKKGEQGQIDLNYLCAKIGGALPDDAIVFNEAIKSSPVVFNQLRRTRPGSIFGNPGSALGSSGGAALGAKLARRDTFVMNVVGDGTFYQSTPETVLAVSRQYGLPILTVVIDDAGWAAVKESTVRMYGEGEAVAASAYEAQLAGGMDFSKLAESAGAYGAKIDHPDAVADALQACISEVRKGRSALLHACVTRI